MSKDRTLQRVEQDIAARDLGKARERLIGLFQQYPTDLEIRARLARVYADLQYPDQAGRFWYLEEQKTEEMSRACEIFERRYGSVPALILNALGSKEVLAGFSDEFSRKTIHDLKKKVLQSGAQAKSPRSPRTGRGSDVGVGCALAILLGIFTFVMGLIRIFEVWIKPIFSEFFER